MHCRALALFIRLILAWNHRVPWCIYARFVQDDVPLYCSPNLKTPATTRAASPVGPVLAPQVTLPQPKLSAREVIFEFRRSWLSSVRHRLGVSTNSYRDKTTCGLGTFCLVTTGRQVAHTRCLPRDPLGRASLAVMAERRSVKKLGIICCAVLLSTSFAYGVPKKPSPIKP